MSKYISQYTGEQIDAGIAKANTALQQHQDISGKQNKTDNTLQTISKQVVGAINELNAKLNIIKSTLDNVLVPNTQYYLDEQSSVSLTMPGDATVGQEILIVFSSGTTACTLTCDLEGFNFVPKANKISWIKFTLCHKADTEVVGDTDKWLVETKEG